MKIDIFTHILPEKYFKTYCQKNKAILEWVEAKSPPVTDIDIRLRLMDRYPDVLHVLTVAQPPLEILVKPDEAVELARIANEELAELVVKYPDKFIAAAACLPLNDMDAALEEVDRAITQLRLKGVQIYSGADAGLMGHPKFKLLCEKMARYDLPIWIHPCSDDKVDEPLFGWPYATAAGMWRS